MFSFSSLRFYNHPVEDLSLRANELKPSPNNEFSSVEDSRSLIRSTFLRDWSEL